MAEENKGPEQSPEGTPTIPETPAPAAPPKGQGSWTPEQQAENTRKLQAHANLVKKAEAQGYDDPVQYITDLETSNTDLKNSVQELNFNEPITDTTEPETETEQPQVDDKRMKALEAVNFNTGLKADWNEYKANLKDGNKGLDRAILYKFMTDNRGLMAQRYIDESLKDGFSNYFELAANEMAFRDFQKNKGVAPAPTKAVDTTTAEQTATVEQSTGDPAPDKKSDNDKRADEIAEDTVYRYPGD